MVIRTDTIDKSPAANHPTTPSLCPSIPDWRAHVGKENNGPKLRNTPSTARNSNDQLWEALSGTISEKRGVPSRTGRENSGNALEASNALNYRVSGTPAVLSRRIPGNALRVFPGSFRNFSGISSGKSQPYWGCGPGTHGDFFHTTALEYGQRRHLRTCHVPEKVVQNLCAGGHSKQVPENLCERCVGASKNMPRLCEISAGVHLHNSRRILGVGLLRMCAQMSRNFR